MAGAEVAECRYVPAGWPEGTRAIVRSARIDAKKVRTDPRSRRRRTIDPAQLALVLGGEADHAYAYSFIVANIGGDPVAIEALFRGRAQVEERIKDSKCGLALRHLPSGYGAVNRVWMWSALLALNLSGWTKGLGGADGDGRAHAKRARRKLICIPAPCRPPRSPGCPALEPGPPARPVPRQVGRNAAAVRPAGPAGERSPAG